MGGLLGGKGKSSSPPPPPPRVDPNEIIGANANANRFNWNTTNGSRTWKKNDDGTWTLNDALNPAEQANYDAVNGLNAGITGLATSRLGGMNSSDPNGTRLWDIMNGALPDGSLDPGSDIGTGLNMGSSGMSNVKVDYSGLPELTSKLDTSSLAKLDQDFSGITDRARNAIYKRTTGLLDPDYERQRRQMADTLANQGIVMGSEAYNEAMNRMDQQDRLSRERAALDADIQAGNEGSRLFGMALQGRQQGVDELMKNAGLASSARSQLAGEREGEAARQIQQGIAGLQAGTQLNIAGMNAATARRGQDLQTRQNAISNELARRGQLMGADQQQFGQLASLLAGARGGVSQLNFGAPQQLDINGAYGIANNANNSSYNAQMNNYTSEQNRQAQEQQQMMQLAMLLMGSDRRLKASITALGRAANGLMRYAYRYIAGGAMFIGYMADEVRELFPHAVVRVGDFDMVNYGAIPS